MKILVVTQYFWPENFRINDLVSELCSRGSEVTVLTGQPNYPSGLVFPEFRLNPNAFLKYKGSEVIRVPMVSRGNGIFRLFLNYVSFAVNATFFGSWRLRRKSFDVIFVYEPSPITVCLPAIFLSRIKRAPLVLWVLDLWPETLKALGIIRNKLTLIIVESFVSYIYSHCDLILTQSRSFIPSIQNLCRRKISIRYFPSWSDTVFDYAAVIPAPEVSKEKNIFSIMFAGNIGDAQDFPTILDAAEILRGDTSIRWLILGDGRLFNWVKSEISRRKLEKSVLLLGRHPLERMPSFFLQANALLITLKNDPVFALTIPGKLQSYLASGLPIVAALNGEGAEIIQKSGAGICSPAGDAQSLAASVKKISTLRSVESKRMGELGLSFGEIEFNREILITRLLVWLKDLCGNNT